MHLFSLLLTMSFTVPSFNADTSRFAACGAPNLTRAETVVSARLYRALCGGNGTPIYQSTIVCSSGQKISFDGGSVCATWWVTTVDAAGNESLLACARGATVNTSSVSVPQVLQLAREGKLYDVSGRRLKEITRSGMYYVREGRSVHPVLVMR